MQGCTRTHTPQHSAHLEDLLHHYDGRDHQGVVLLVVLVHVAVVPAIVRGATTVGSGAPAEVVLHVRAQPNPQGAGQLDLAGPGGMEGDGGPAAIRGVVHRQPRTQTHAGGVRKQQRVR